MQYSDGAIARVVHELIVRFFILANHELCEVPSEEGFDSIQNMEQLSQNLISLQHCTSSRHLSLSL